MDTERHLIVVVDFSISTAFLKQNLNGKKYMGFAENGEKDWFTKSSWNLDDLRLKGYFRSLEGEGCF